MTCCLQAQTQRAAVLTFHLNCLTPWNTKHWNVLNIFRFSTCSVCVYLSFSPPLIYSAAVGGGADLRPRLHNVLLHCLASLSDAERCAAALFVPEHPVERQRRDAPARRLTMSLRSCPPHPPRLENYPSLIAFLPLLAGCLFHPSSSQEDEAPPVPMVPAKTLFTISAGLDLPHPRARFPPLRRLPCSINNGSSFTWSGPQPPHFVSPQAGDVTAEQVNCRCLTTGET